MAIKASSSPLVGAGSKVANPAGPRMASKGAAITKAVAGSTSGIDKSQTRGASKSVTPSQKAPVGTPARTAMQKPNSFKPAVAARKKAFMK